MNNLVGVGWTRRLRSNPAAGAASSVPAPWPHELPLLLGGLALALVLLAYFVQVLDEHVQRAQQLRQAQHRSAPHIDTAGQRQAAHAAPQGLVQTAAR